MGRTEDDGVSSASIMQESAADANSRMPNSAEKTFIALRETY
jgi:hypothetical protein